MPHKYCKSCQVLVDDNKRYIFANAYNVARTACDGYGYGYKHTANHQMLIGFFHFIVVKCLDWFYDKLIFHAIQSNLGCDHLYKNCRYHPVVQLIGNDRSILDKYLKSFSDELVVNILTSFSRRNKGLDCDLGLRRGTSFLNQDERLYQKYRPHDDDSDRGSSQEIDDSLPTFEDMTIC